MYEGDVDEDDVAIATHRELITSWPNLQLLIAPRKPERFDVVAEKLRAAGLDYVRRSSLRGDGSPQVILLDSVGELGSLFELADIVFMGGTLARRGGHNILEPALCGKPVIAGRHLENFAEIRDRFAASHGYVEIQEPGELADAIATLLMMLAPGNRWAPERKPWPRPSVERPPERSGLSQRSAGISCRVLCHGDPCGLSYGSSPDCGLQAVI